MSHPEDHKRHAHTHDPRRSGARQPERFDPHRADMLDDVSRLDYLPPAKVFELLDPPQGGLVVDFGVGTGTYAILLARARPDVTVVALDEQPEMLARLQSKPEAGQLKNLRPFLPEAMKDFHGKADRVLALNVLHELGDDALEGMKGLLRPAGFALCIDWNADVERPVGPPKDHVYAPAEAVERLEHWGFSAERLDPFPYHFALRLRLR